MARPLGLGMGCLLWIQHLIDIMSQFLQLLIQNLTILDRVIMALDCTIIWTCIELWTVNNSLLNRRTFRGSTIIWNFTRFLYHQENQNCHHWIIIYSGITTRWDRDIWIKYILDIWFSKFFGTELKLLKSAIRPRQDGRHFADDIFTCIFFNENCCTLMKLSLKYVRKGPINNNPAMVQIMAWRRSGAKPLSEPMMISLLTHIYVTRPQWVNPCRGSVNNCPSNYVVSMWPQTDTLVDTKTFENTLFSFKCFLLWG